MWASYSAPNSWQQGAGLGSSERDPAHQSFLPGKGTITGGGWSGSQAATWGDEPHARTRHLEVLSGEERRISKETMKETSLERSIHLPCRRPGCQALALLSRKPFLNLMLLSPSGSSTLVHPQRDGQQVGSKWRMSRKKRKKIPQPPVPWQASCWGRAGF